MDALQKYLLIFDHSLVDLLLNYYFTLCKLFEKIDNNRTGILVLNDFFGFLLLISEHNICRYILWIIELKSFWNFYFHFFQFLKYLSKLWVLFDKGQFFTPEINCLNSIKNQFFTVFNITFYLYQKLHFTLFSA